MICLPTARKPASSLGKRGLPFLSLGKLTGSRLFTQSLKVLKRIFSATWATTYSFGLPMHLLASTRGMSFSSSLSLPGVLGRLFVYPELVFATNLPWRRLFKRPSPERTRSDLYGFGYVESSGEFGLTERLWGSLVKASKDGYWNSRLTFLSGAGPSKELSAEKAKSSTVASC